MVVFHVSTFILLLHLAGGPDLIKPKANETILFIYSINGEDLMRVFKKHKKNKMHLTDEQKKWNKMWSLWVENRTNSPYTELMTYQSEVNNGGHTQYFLNIQKNSDIQKEMATLETVLSAQLQKNLQNAYRAYLELNINGLEEKAETSFEHCDDIFFENEEEINRTLKKHAEKIEL